MFSIGNGKSRFIYNYKAAELIKSRPKNYKYPNYLTSYNKDINSKLKLKSFSLEKQKPSKYFIKKNKEIEELRKQIELKKVDILINKALEKSNTIRNYTFNLNSKNIKILKEKIFNKTNYIFPNIFLEKKNMRLPSFSQELIKKNIINTVDHFFPERYFGKKYKKKLEKIDLKKQLKEAKKFDEYKKIYTIKYIKPGPVIKEDKILEQKKKEYNVVGPAITIYNHNNKKKFLINDEGKKNKKIDVGLNTIQYLC